MRNLACISLGAFLLAACVPGPTPAILPPASPQQPPQQAAVDAYGLPLGPTHDLILRKCTVCHGEANFATLHLNSDEWAGFIGSMNADLSEAEFWQIHDYLTAALPRKPAPASIKRAD